MDELGHILREARENKGYSLEDVQEKIRINAKYLKALETGDYSALPTPVHVRGFLRNYARFLGLDPQPLLDRYETNLNRQPAKSKVAAVPQNEGGLVPPSIQPNAPVFYDPVNVEVNVGQRRNPETMLRLVIIVVVIVVLGLVANRFVPILMGDGDGSDAITDGFNDVLLDITNRAVGTATASAGEATPSDNADTSVIVVPGAPITSTSRNIVGTPGPAPTRPTLPATMDEINLRLDVSERTWMEVTIDGNVVFSGWARNGDPPYEWTANEEAKVNTGNAVGIFVTINDIAWGRMGERGENKEEVWRTTN
jgi:cytoskeleton protein RodZ